MTTRANRPRQSFPPPPVRQTLLPTRVPLSRSRSDINVSPLLPSRKMTFTELQNRPRYARSRSIRQADCGPCPSKMDVTPPACALVQIRFLLSILHQPLRSLSSNDSSTSSARRSSTPHENSNGPEQPRSRPRLAITCLGIRCFRLRFFDCDLAFTADQMNSCSFSRTTITGHGAARTTRSAGCQCKSVSTRCIRVSQSR